MHPTSFSNTYHDVKFQRKTSAVKSLFNKVAVLKACRFIKKRLYNTVVSMFES